MSVAVAACWALLAAIHLIPAVALFRPAMIQTLYGVDPAAPSFVLLHHRAALFAVVVVICVAALFDPSVRRLASVAVFISMATFVMLWWNAGQPAALRTIAIADMVGLAPLAVVAWQAWRAA